LEHFSYCNLKCKDIIKYILISIDIVNERIGKSNIKEKKCLNYGIINKGYVQNAQVEMVLCTFKIK